MTSLYAVPKQLRENDLLRRHSTATERASDDCAPLNNGARRGRPMVRIPSCFALYDLPSLLERKAYNFLLRIGHRRRWPKPFVLGV
jgi:hypothetical protein